MPRCPAWSSGAPERCSTSPRSPVSSRCPTWRCIRRPRPSCRPSPKRSTRNCSGTGVSVTVLCPGPVPTEWGEIANAERFSIPIAQVSPHDVAEAGDRRHGGRQTQRGARNRAQSRQHRRPLHAAQPAAARPANRQPPPRRAQPLMAKVDVTADVPMSPQDMWDHVSDLSQLGDWLTMHEGWRSELPDELAEGTQIVGVARAKGFRNRVTWTVTTWDPPQRVALSGSGKGGAKYTVTLSVAARHRRLDAGGASRVGWAGAVRSGGGDGGPCGQRRRGEIAEAVRRAVRIAKQPTRHPRRSDRSSQRR